MADYFLANGIPVDTVSLSDRGLAYGDGLFETIKVVGGCPALFDLHLSRLGKGCERLSIPIDMELLQTEVRQLLANAPTELGVLKIIVTRGGGDSGYGAVKPVSINRYLKLRALSPNIDGLRYQRMQSGVNLRLCDHRLPINPALAGIKHLNRLDNVIARGEWSSQGIDEGLMMDCEGRVVEGTMSNLFLVSGRTLVTPSLHRCGVEGTVRAVVLSTLAETLNLETQVRDVAVSDIVAADEVFICNSLMGICPVLSLGCVKKSAGPVTMSLQAALGELH